jgi:hypothetical protein
MRKLFLVAIGAAMLVTTIGAEPTLAANSNCGGSATRWDGAISANPPNGGYTNLVGADVQVRATNLCSNIGTEVAPFSAAWTALANNAGTSWAQIGYFEGDTTGPCSANNHVFFVDWKPVDSGDMCYLVEDSNGHDPSNGDFHNFEVLRGDIDGICTNSSNYCLFMLLDNACPIKTSTGNTYCFHSGWDPHEKWTNSFGEFSGETHRYGDDIVGDDNGNTAVFKNVSENGQVGNYNLSFISGNLGNSTSSCPYYKANSISNDQKFEIWTHPPSHNNSCS